MAIVCSVVPSEEIHNIWIYEGKLAAGTLAVVGSAWFLYRREASAARSPYLANRF